MAEGKVGVTSSMRCGCHVYKIIDSQYKLVGNLNLAVWCLNSFLSYIGTSFGTTLITAAMLWINLRLVFSSNFFSFGHVRDQLSWLSKKTDESIQDGAA